MSSKKRFLSEGTLFAERFQILSLAGSGGMGVVYRTHDLRSGQEVALKLFHTNGGAYDSERFQREATVLAELRHPGIVSYVTHGRSADGQPFLAMEWLDGEDLAQRLSRQPLTVADSLLLVRRAAAALNEAHARGIVHRDIKPSNLFLRERSLEQTVLLDFGIARRAGLTMTGTGVIVGTPDYMAPEQARGQRDIGPPADVFALGCVLFECLIGHSPFSAEHVAAVLARILFEETPRLRKRRPELPESVEALVARMLDEDPAQQPQDAAALLLELADLQIPAELGGPDPMAHTLWQAAVLQADSEPRVACVLIALPPEGEAEGNTLDPPSDERLRSQLESLRGLLLQNGVRAEALLDGSLVASLTDIGESVTTVKDRAAQVARLALLIREQWPGSRVAVATGRGQVHDSDPIPVGEVIHRAVKLARSSSSSSNTGSIRLDDVTAGLLDARFQVRADTMGAFTLDSAELSADETRLLLGKPTPCVGRDSELGTLETAFRDCIEESSARAALVTAPPGIGKSRLRHEFLRRLQTHAPEALIMIGRGDPLSVGAPFGMLGQGLRQLCGIYDGEPLDSRRAKLRQRVAAYVPAREASRVTEFLGELCSVPFPDESSILLRSGRQDPQVMADHIGRAWLDFLTAECADHPLVIVLEDLHWGDALTIKMIRLALQSLRAQPLFVLALGRPEVEALLPRPWPELAQHLILRPLGKRASEKLVQQVLGKQVDPGTVARIVEQAAGHALFLEELIRAAAESNGKERELPGTVLAILHERIERLESGCRRALRAASVFGETCWLGGIRVLLGELVQDDTLTVWMQHLSHNEILEERLTSRIPGEREYRFRHALMRDAAYELLSEEERQSGHRLVGRFLEEHGEPDTVKLAEHFRLGEDLKRAIHYYLKAAEQSLEAFDLDAAASCANRGLDSGARGEARGALLSVKVSAGLWREAWEEILALGLEALELLPEGSVRWCRLLYGLFPASVFQQRFDVLQWLPQRFLAVEPEMDARGHYIRAGCWLTAMFTLTGEASRVFLDRTLRVGTSVDPSDRLTVGYLKTTEATHYHMVAANPWKHVFTQREGSRAFLEAGDRRTHCLVSAFHGKALTELGDHRQAEAVLRESLRLAEELGERLNLDFARIYLARVLVSSGLPEHLDEAEELARVVLSGKNLSILGLAHGVLACAAARRGDLDQAEAWARRGCDSLRPLPGNRWDIVGLLVQILIQQGKIEEAVRTGVEALAAFEKGGCRTFNEVSLRLAVAEAHHAAGDFDAARDTLRKALDTIEVRAEMIQIQHSETPI